MESSRYLSSREEEDQKCTSFPSEQQSGVSKIWSLVCKEGGIFCAFSRGNGWVVEGQEEQQLSLKRKVSKYVNENMDVSR